MGDAISDIEGVVASSGFEGVLGGDSTDHDADTACGSAASAAAADAGESAAGCDSCRCTRRAGLGRDAAATSGDTIFGGSTGGGGSCIAGSALPSPLSDPEPRI